MSQLYVDLDGVLCDYLSHFEKEFGYRPNLEDDSPLNYVELMNRHGHFYDYMPRMPRTLELWEKLKEFHPRPIVLTGIHSGIRGIIHAKTEWVHEMIDPAVPVICCKSHRKAEYCSPGDILIDDRVKWAHLWKQVGGIFIHHKGVDETIAILKNFPTFTL